MQPNEIRKQRDGTREIEVCGRIIDAVVEKVKGDPTKGHHTVKSYCSRPLVLSISDNTKKCPRCEKEPAIGNVHPRVTNSAAIGLTAKELAECGVTGKDPSLVPTKAPKKTREAKKAVEAKVNKVKKDTVTIEVALSTLEGAEDIAALFIRQASEALNGLPTPTLAESKRLIKLQEKLDSLLKV